LQQLFLTLWRGLNERAGPEDHLSPRVTIDPELHQSINLRVFPQKMLGPLLFTGLDVV
jgi:hypothetical protein